MTRMLCGHKIEIEEDFDKKRQCFTARIVLTEYRQGRQYGGAVVWEHTGMKNEVLDGHDKFMRDVTDLVKREVLSLLTFKIEK